MSAPISWTRRVPTVARGRRRGLRWRTVLIWILLVLLTVVAAGDTLAARYATNELRARLAAELTRLDVRYATLDVSIAGYPFLTQVARGNYNQISIDMTEVRLPDPTGRGRATLPALHVVGEGVDAKARDILGGRPEINARLVTGTATVSFGTLETIVDYAGYGLSEVTYAEAGGSLRATGVLDLAKVDLARLGLPWVSLAGLGILGLKVPVAAVADLTVVDGQLYIQLRDLRAVNRSLPTVVTDVLTGLAQRSLAAALPGLPFGLVLQEVTVRSDGLAVIASGRDVALLG